MDKKLMAALGVAIVGVIVGVIGIVMADDAKKANEKTQAALEKQIKDNDRSAAAKVAAAAAAAKVVEKRIANKANKVAQQDQDSIKQAEQRASSQVAANQASITTLQSKITELEAEIADVEGKQKSNTAKVNARIDQLSARVNAGG